MDSINRMVSRFRNLPPFLRHWLGARLRRMRAVRRLLDHESAAMMDGLAESLKPYREAYATYTRLPEDGLPPDDLLEVMEAMQAQETPRWADGYASGTVYHGDAEHIEFMNRVYSLHSQTNPLHADLFPSVIKYESEIIAMTADMLGGEHAESACGTVTSGGTESILLAMKTYRDWARAERGIRKPEILAPISAHAAFFKAAQYFGMRLRLIPLDEDYRASVAAARRKLNRNTAVIVGSAPSFPHGSIDPIAELSALALRHKIGFHTDACLGGFVLPWARQLGYPVPEFDFRLPGVTSISVDTHKYGYAAKGTSVVLYRNQALRRYQYFTTGDWQGGLYVTPTFAGSRPGALSAVCWATLLKIGARGYREATQRILKTAERIKQGIAAIPELRILGQPLWVIAFTSERPGIYQIMEAMSRRGWMLNGLFNPPAVHLCVTLRHTQPGVVERFLSHLRQAIDEAREMPADEGEMAPMYGMASGFPFRGMVEDVLKAYLDALYQPG